MAGCSSRNVIKPQGLEPLQFPTKLRSHSRPRVQREVKELPPIENTLSTVTSLTDHLTWQLSALADAEEFQAIGTAIIGNLDSDGYLVASIDELATMG